jgi:hypothetical protein
MHGVIAIFQLFQTGIGVSSLEINWGYFYIVGEPACLIADFKLSFLP